jgi:hypothetical protein
MMFSKSSHLLQYRVELHDQYYQKGYADQSKVHRLSALDQDLLSINRKIWNDGKQQLIDTADAVKGAIAAIRILNLCGKNASQAFMCDGIADPNDANALLIAGHGLSKAIREFALKGDVKYLRIIVMVVMEMLSVYVRQCWAHDNDLNEAIVEQLDLEAVDDLFYPFHRIEIQRLMGVALTTLPTQTPHSSLPM